MTTFFKSSATAINARRRDAQPEINSPADLVSAYVVAALRRDLPAAIAIGGSSRLGADLGLDSLAMMELIFCLEDRFAVSIPLEAAARVSTVDELVDELKWHLQHRQTKAAA